MTQSSATVAIAGGGLAGLAAACALADSGFRVTVFEKRPFLGGRASSWEHPGTGEVVDNCQHVLFRLCTNLIEFYERIGVADQIRWFDEMNFIEPGGRISVLQSSMLPAPLHTAPSFLRFPFLSAADKMAIAQALIPLTLSEQRDTGKSFQQWLALQGQTHNAVQRFWRPILVSALSDELDRISIPAAAQVIRMSMMSPESRQMGVPTVPLTDLYNAAGDYIRARSGTLHFRTSLAHLSPSDSRVTIRTRAQMDYRESQTAEVFDYFISALPFDAFDRILVDTPNSAALREQVSHFETSPITGIHLWFDRQISDLDHAVLLDRTVQWMFHKSRLQPMRSESSLLAKAGKSGTPKAGDVGGSYIELVVSSSRTLIDKSRAEIVDLALREVHEFFPAARTAKLVKSTVIKELNATYSPRPGIDAYRPSAITRWPRVFLAGDWTATGWPATMESAVRSGYLAAEAVCRAAGQKDVRFISPDLRATGLMRMFA